MSASTEVIRSIKACIINTAPKGIREPCDVPTEHIPPLYPIIITHPEGGARLQSGDIEFRGTAEPDSVITAPNGEDVDVDADGMWIHEQQFNPGLHIVHFTGPEGQRAYIKFFVEEMPLSINIRDYEEVEGDLWVFRESVEFYGMADPGAAIVINGAFVQANYAGEWSYTTDFESDEVHTVIATTWYGQASISFISWWPGSLLVSQESAIDAGGYFIEI